MALQIRRETRVAGGECLEGVNPVEPGTGEPTVKQEDRWRRGQVGTGLLDVGFPDEQATSFSQLDPKACRRRRRSETPERGCC